MQTTLDSFEALDAHVEQRYKELGLPFLTPIQDKSYRLLVRGKNALLVAPTGSGKTEAAVIPIFSRLAAGLTPERRQTMGIRMLYVTPMRALNRDILRRIVSYAETEGLRTDLRHGDTSASARAKMLAKPPDVLITTPETLGIILASRKFGRFLSELEVVVLDEVHEILGSERGAHLAISLERVQRIAKNKEFIRIGLSATVGDLSEAASFVAGTKRKCAIVTDSTARGHEIKLSYINGNLSTLAVSILGYVKELGGENQSTLVFTNTRDEAEFLGAVLKAKSPEIPVEVHHGSLSKESREATESILRGGRAGIVVCTSSLELGLDIGDVNLVVQVGSPRQAVKLIQRVGRSKHRIRERAVGRIMISRLDDELECKAIIERVDESSLEVTAVQEKPLDVVAHHLAGLALEESSTKMEDVLSLLKQAYPFRNLTLEDLDSVARILERQGIIRYDTEIIKRRGPRTYQYYFSNSSMIPDIQQFEVIDVSTKKIVGRLDQVFVGEYGEAGKPFVLKGNTWRIVSIDDDKKVLYAEPMTRDLTTIPFWVGELLPVELETAEIVGRLRRELAQNTQMDDLISKEQNQRLLNTHVLLGSIPDEHTIVIEQKKASTTFVVHGCFGTKINQTLATLLSTLLSAKIGYLVETKSDSYRIVLSTNGTLESKHIIEVLKDEIVIPEILSASIIGTHPLNWKTWYVSKKFGIIDKSAEYDRRAARLIQERYRGTALYSEILRELFREKYDIEGTMSIMDRLRSGSMKIKVAVVDEYSDLARPILEFASSFAALPLTMEKTILDLVKTRLGNVKHKFLCLSCGRYESVQKTNDVKEPMICPLCHSRLVTETYSSDVELPRIIQRKKSGKELSEEEEKKFRRAWKTSSLIQNFGKRAVLILSGFGVGVDTAARIIRRTADEDQFYRNIYIAEKNYVATRGFWQD